MVWVILRPLGVAIAKSFHLSPAQKGLMVAVPVLSGAILRLVAGILVDHMGPKRTGPCWPRPSSWRDWRWPGSSACTAMVRC